MKTKKTKREGKKFLRRYMKLAHAIDLLATGKLAFLDPKTWTDKNDAYFINAYKAHGQFKSILACCFTQSSERHHHWERFAKPVREASKGPAKVEGDNDTVCVVFDKEKLLASLPKTVHLRAGEVKYKEINEIKKASRIPADWPYLKRYPYRDEQEYRIIVESEARELDAPLGLRISLKAIDRVVVGPFASLAKRDSMVARIKKAAGPRRSIRVSKTTILDNAQWRKAVDIALGRAKRA